MSLYLENSSVVDVALERGDVLATVVSRFMGPSSAAVPAALGSETVASLAAAASRCSNPIPSARRCAPSSQKSGAGSAGAVPAASAEAPVANDKSAGSAGAVPAASAEALAAAVDICAKGKDRVLHADINRLARVAAWGVFAFALLFMQADSAIKADGGCTAIKNTVAPSQSKKCTCKKRSVKVCRSNLVSGGTGA